MDIAPQVKAKNIVQNVSVIDGYMVIVFALGIIKFRANSHKYHLKLDLKGELAFVHQQRLSGGHDLYWGPMIEKQRDRCRLMMSEAFLCFSPSFL